MKSLIRVVGVGGLLGIWLGAWFSPAVAAEYRINPLPEVRQQFDPRGIAYFATPFWNGAGAVIRDSTDHFFVINRTSLLVYFKADDYWQLFTLSDGYQPMEATGYIQYSDYRDCLAVYGDSTWDPRPRVNLFDKRSRRIRSIMPDEYRRLKGDWQPDNYHADDGRWYRGTSTNWTNLIYRESNYPRWSEYAWSLEEWNEITEMEPGGSSLAMVTGNGVRVIAGDDTEVRYGLQGLSHDWRGWPARVHGNRLLARSASDQYALWDFERGETVAELGLPADGAPLVADFNERYLCFAQGSTVVVKRLATGRETLRLELSSPVTEINYRDPRFILLTAAGFTVIDPALSTVAHFLGNQERSDTDADRWLVCCGGYLELDRFTWVGQDGSCLIGRVTPSAWATDSAARLVAYDCRTGRLCDSPAAVIPPQFQEPLMSAEAAWVDGRFGFWKRAGTDTYIVARCQGDVLEVLTEFCLIQGRDDQSPMTILQGNSDQPYGTRFTACRFFGDRFWLATDCGLFSLSLPNGDWRSHLVYSPLVVDAPLFVTREGLYSYWGENDLWMRIDRGDFQVRSLRGNQLPDGNWRGATNAPAEREGDRIVLPLRTGVGWYDQLHQRSGFIPTPEPVTRVVFHRGDILAASQRYLYRLSVDSGLVETDTFPVPLSSAPCALAIDGDTLWLGSEYALTRYDLQTGVQQRYPLLECERVRWIIADSEKVWIFSSEQILCYEKETDLLRILGKIGFRWQQERSYTHFFISDVVTAGDRFYLAGVRGMAELDRRSQALRYNDLGLLETTNYLNPIQIKYDTGLYFLGLGEGILQIPADQFERGFQVSDQLQWSDGWPFNWIKGAIVPPIDEAITLATRSDTYLLYLDLREAFARNGLPVPRQVGEIAGALGEQPLRIDFCGPAIPNCYKVLLTAGLLDQIDFPTTLEVWDTQDGRRVSLGSWPIRESER